MKAKSIRHRSWRRVGGTLMAVGFCSVSCAGPGTAERIVPPAPPAFHVTHHVGGAHRGAAAFNGLWYQAFGPSLLVLDPATGNVLSALAIGEPGRDGPVVDLTMADQRLFAVVEDDAVIDIDIVRPPRPRVVTRVDAETLGIKPRSMSVANGELYVIGSGATGIVRWRDRQAIGQVRDDTGPIGSVAVVNESLVACAGRRVLRVDDGHYLGAASELIPWSTFRNRTEAFVFLLRGQAGDSVGLMSTEVREIDRVEIHQPIRRVRVFGDRIWVVLDAAVVVFRVEQSRLIEAFRIEAPDMRGLSDVVPLDGSHVGVAGSFGRLSLWIEGQLRGPGWLVDWTHRGLDDLDRVWTDARHVIVGSSRGHWLMDPATGGLEPVVPPDVDWMTSQQTAALALGQATIEPGSQAITISLPMREPDAKSKQVQPSSISRPSSISFAEPGDATIHCVAAIDGRLWLGTDQGITMLDILPSEPGRPPAIEVRDRLRLDGQVRFILPVLPPGAACYITRQGGIGVIQP